MKKGKEERKKKKREILTEKEKKKSYFFFFFNQLKITNWTDSYVCYWEKNEIRLCEWHMSLMVRIMMTIACVTARIGWYRIGWIGWHEFRLTSELQLLLYPHRWCFFVQSFFFLSAGFHLPLPSNCFFDLCPTFFSFTFHLSSISFSFPFFSFFFFSFLLAKIFYKIFY